MKCRSYESSRYVISSIIFLLVFYLDEAISSLLFSEKSFKICDAVKPKIDPLTSIQEPLYCSTPKNYLLFSTVEEHK